MTAQAYSYKRIFFKLNYDIKHKIMTFFNYSQGKKYAHKASRH